MVFSFFLAWPPWERQIVRTRRPLTNQQGQPFYFIDEEVEGREGKWSAKVTQPWLWAVCLPCLGASCLYLQTGLALAASVTEASVGKPRESGRPSSDCDVLWENTVLTLRVRNGKEPKWWTGIELNLPLFCFLALFVVLQICANCLESELEIVQAEIELKANAGRFLQVLCELGSPCVQWQEAGGRFRGQTVVPERSVSKSPGQHWPCGDSFWHWCPQCLLVEREGSLLSVPLGPAVTCGDNIHRGSWGQPRTEQATRARGFAWAWQPIAWVQTPAWPVTSCVNLAELFSLSEPWLSAFKWFLELICPYKRKTCDMQIRGESLGTHCPP